MKQKILSLKVVASDGALVKEVKPASIQHIQAALTLYDDVGTHFDLDIEESEFDMRNADVS